MSSKSSSKSTGSKAATHNKGQSKTLVGTRLWSADDKLFHEIVGRRRTKPAILLREIVHDWAVTFRLSGQAKDPNDLPGPIRKLHEQILAEQLRPVNETLASLRQSNSEMFSLLQSLAEELASAKEQLAALRAFAVAHHLLSGQTYTATWASLEFTQFIAERFLMSQPEFKNNYREEAITRRDEARLDALELVEQMSLDSGYPDEFKKLILFTPPK